MITVERHNWSAVKDGNDKRTALMRCPTCQRYCSLSDHDIDNVGMVLPSVVCGYDDCDFHDMVTLEGWNNE